MMKWEIIQNAIFFLFSHHNLIERKHKKVSAIPICDARRKKAVAATSAQRKKWNTAIVCAKTYFINITLAWRLIYVAFPCSIHQYLASNKAVCFSSFNEFSVYPWIYHFLLLQRRTNSVGFIPRLVAVCSVCMRYVLRSAEAARLSAQAQLTNTNNKRHVMKIYSLEYGGYSARQKKLFIISHIINMRQ